MLVVILRDEPHLQKCACVPSVCKHCMLKLVCELLPHIRLQSCGFSSLWFVHGLCEQQMLISDYTDAQTDLSLAGCICSKTHFRLAQLIMDASWLLVYLWLLRCYKTMKKPKFPGDGGFFRCCTKE